MNSLTIVAGMHRSGTSALTGALSQMGFYSGGKEALIKANKFNPGGYFENKSIVEINEELLLKSIDHWSPELIRNNRFSSPQDLTDYGWILGAYINHKYSESGFPSEDMLSKMELAWNKIVSTTKDDSHIILKDPRFSLTLPWWKQILPPFKLIVPVRNPNFVSDSLSRRDSLPRCVSIPLWIIYNLRILQYTKNTECLTISSEELIAAPRTSFSRICDFLQYTNITESQLDRCTGFINPANYHAHPSSDDQDSLLDITYKHICTAKDTQAITHLESLLEQSNLFYSVDCSVNYVHTMRDMKEKDALIMKYKNKTERLSNHPVFGLSIRLWKKYINKEFDVLSS